MPLIPDLEIENFRCFKKLRVQGLTRVNLFVGANNSGKTALLEAVEIGATGRMYRVLNILERRREYLSLRGSGDGSIPKLLDVAMLVRGQYWEGDGALFEIRFGDSVSLAVQPAANGAKALRISGLSRGGSVSSRRSGEEVFLFGGVAVREDLRDSVQDPLDLQSSNVRFTPSGPPQVGDIASMLRREDEPKALAALRVVDPRIESIIEVDPSGRDGGASIGIKFSFPGKYGLGSLGEGAARLANLAVFLARCSGGTLLIDELENGIHWEAMPKLWRFLTAAARELDVQVFATTHSKDCLEAIARLHEEDPALVEDVTVFRLESGREEPVRFTAARIAELTQMQADPR